MQQENNDRHQRAERPSQQAVRRGAFVELSELLLFVRDPANICTFATCTLITIAIACINEERYYFAISMFMAANITDLLDGQIARSTPDRHPAVNTFGRIIDLVTEVSSIAAPPLLLAKFSQFQFFPVCVSTLYFAAGNFRMAQHVAVGPGKWDSGDMYLGIWGEYNLCLVSVVIHILPIVEKSTFVLVLSFILLLLTYGMITTTLRCRRFFGFNIILAMLFSAGMCITSAVLEARKIRQEVTQVIQTDFDFWSVEQLSFICHAFLAYPCLFKHVYWNKSVR